MSLDQALMLPGIDAVTLASFPNLHGWWPGDQIPSQTDNTALVTWPDQAGNSRDAAKLGAAANSGIYRSTSGPNGKPYVRFEGSHAMQATWAGIAQPNVIVAVMRWYSDPTTTEYAIEGGATLEHRIWCDNAADDWAFGGSAGNAHPSGTNVDTSWHVVCAEFDGASSAFYLDGSALLTSKDVGAASLSGVTIGGTVSATFHSTIEVAELAVYSALQSAANRTAIINHLKTKYGVA